MKFKEIIKDIRILIYLIAVLASIAFLAYVFNSSAVIVENSTALKQGTYIYSINDCQIKRIEDINRCKEYLGEMNVIKTSEGDFIFNYTEIEYILNTSGFMEVSPIRLGVDIGGGYTIILRPVENLTSEQVELAARIIEGRLNSYGIKAINIYYTSDGYIIVQLPYSEVNLVDKIMQQGYFYATIGNETIFTGNDVVAILTSPPNAGVVGCERVGTEWVCTYRFGLVISKEAAKKFAEVTRGLSITFIGGHAYLNESITFFLDGKNVSSLNIAADLKGKEATEVAITVSGSGPTKYDAAKDATERAKDLQVVLANGQLPSKFEVSNIIKIPPLFGAEVLTSVAIAAIATIVTIFIVLFISYRRTSVAILLFSTMLSEFIIALAILIAIGTVLDIPAILGILVGMVTGIDDQLVTADEVIRGRKEGKVKEKIDKAKFIILVAILLEILAAFPIFIGGLGLLKGFATALIITALSGYFITRPAFIKLAERLI